MRQRPHRGGKVVLLESLGQELSFLFWLEVLCY